MPTFDDTASVMTADLPLIAWVFLGAAIVLSMVWRFGWDGARSRLTKRRALCGGSLVLALVATATLHLSGWPMPHYL